MRKAFGTISVAAIVATAEAFARSRLPSSSPFVGKHKDARTIEHGNGRVTNKMHTVKAAYNKYESFIERENLFKSRTAKNEASSFSEYFFGKQEPAKSRYSGSSHRLGADITQVLVNTDGTMWTGPMYMGGNILMDVVYDTGSDWLVIEGSDCNNCEGNTYNLDDSEGTP